MLELRKTAEADIAVYLHLHMYARCKGGLSMRERDDPRDILRTYFRLTIRRAFAQRGDIFQLIQRDWKETAPSDLHLVPELVEPEKTYVARTNYGDFIYNPQTHRITSPLLTGEIRIDSHFERVALTSFLEQAPNSVSYQALITKAYDLPTTYLISSADAHGVRANIYRLRQRIRDVEKDGEFIFIQNIRSRMNNNHEGGYRFNGMRKI